MNRLTTILLFLVLTICIIGCSPRYAIVAVTTVDANSNSSIYSKVYSGKDGLYLGDAPALNYLVSKKNIGKNRTMCLIVEAECYTTKWEIIEVSKWAKSEADARNAININKVLFRLEADTCCLKNK